MNKAASAREPVSYDEIGDAIVPLRKQGQFIKKYTWRDHSQFFLSQGPHHMTFAIIQLINNHYALVFTELPNTLVY